MVGRTHVFFLGCNHCRVSHTHKYHSAIKSLAQCIAVALSTEFAEMNVSFIDGLTKNDRKKGMLNTRSYVEVR